MIRNSAMLNLITDKIIYCAKNANICINQIKNFISFSLFKCICINLIFSFQFALFYQILKELSSFQTNAYQSLHI